MKPITAIAAMSGLVLLFVGGLLFQRCSFEKQLAQQQAVATKADTQLVDTTRELGAEKVQESQTKGVMKRAAVAAAVEEEVAHETGGDADFAGWFNERTGGD